MRLNNLAVTIVAIGIPLTAHAADLPSKRSAMPPTYVVAKVENWTGGYLGVIGGYAWGNADINTANFGNTSNVKLEPDGWLIGPQLGYDYQMNNNVVIGIVGDYAWANVKGSTCVEFDSNVCSGNPSDSYATGNISQFGTIRGRLGYALDNILIYGTGGLAHADTSAQISNINGVDSVSANKKLWGWTAGVGAEVKMASNMSFGVEYLYADFGKSTYEFTPNFGGTQSAEVNLNANILRASLNYRF